VITTGFFLVYLVCSVFVFAGYFCLYAYMYVKGSITSRVCHDRYVYTAWSEKARPAHIFAFIFETR